MTELSPEAKKLLRIAREEFAPADQRVTAVRDALQLRLQGGIAAAGAGAGRVARLLRIGLVATTFAAGALVIAARSPLQTTPRTPAVGSQPVATAQRDLAHGAARPSVAADPLAAGAPQVERISVARAAPRSTPQPRPRVALGVHELHSAIRSPGARLSARDDRSAAVAPAPASSSRAADDRDTALPAVAPADHAAAPVAQDDGAAPADDSLAREIALLSRARAALAHHDPGLALALTDEHAALFATGTMRQERLAARVLALCALHRRSDAVEAKRELERIAPRSPHLMRIRESCAAEDVPSEVK